MKFSNWLEGKRELAQSYRQTLSGVPQDPHHHPEGDALIHTQLVRKAIPRAVQELQNLQRDPNMGPALANINFSISPEEQQILALAAWLHDIGKSTATTIGGQPWRTPGATGRIQAIGHESPEHYQPQLEKLKDIAPPETVNLYLKNKDLINFIIEHHMDFTSGVGFSKGFLANHFQNGVVNNTPEMKLLLILMWADKMGRKPEDTITASIGKNTSNLAASVQRSQAKAANIKNQSTAFTGGPEEFAQVLNSKAMAKTQKVQALKGKFPYLTDQQIATLLPEGFRGFLEMTEMQPTIKHIHIPLGDHEQDVRLLSKALKQGDPSVQVYVVGGAVRDFLHGAKMKDVDLTTSLSEPEIMQRLAQSRIPFKEKTSLDTFGVVFTHVNGRDYEIAPFRKDIGGSDGRRPDSVERGTIHDDAMRRDLTINNLYYDFDKDLILDFNPGGQGLKDIESKKVQSVGDPNDRFQEDKLRVLRLARFFSRFNDGDIMSHLDTRHRAAVEKFKGLIGITPERIETEFAGGIKQSLNTAQYLKNLVDLGLMPRILPGLQVDVAGIPRIGNLKNIKVILAWILRSNQNVNKALNRLKYPSDISEPVQFLINSLTLDHNNIFSTVKKRDATMITQQDLTDMAMVAGDPSIANKLTHLGSYKPVYPTGEELMGQGLKGIAVGDEQKRVASNHYQQSFQDYMKQRDVQPLQ